MTLITRRRSLALLATAAATPLMAEPIYLDGRGLAMRGYDPVGYFQHQEAIPGKMDHELVTPEAIWRFNEAANMAAFRETPSAYMPQYGGFCAEGIARGFKRVSDPTVWVMIGGKLYLHYTIEAQNRWADDIRGNIRAGDENWPGLKKL